MRTLVPIRPVGMTDEAASDWVATVFADTLEISDGMFLEGCSKARRECDHPRQVLKTIHAANAEVVRFKRQLDAIWSPSYEPPRQIEATPAQKLISQTAGSLKA